MKYILSNKENNYNSSTLKNDILELKGIDNPNEYLHLTNKDSISYNKLKNINKAIKCLLKHIENKDNIYIQIDNDVDGITSAAMLYNYLSKSCKNTIFYGIGEGKTHGIDIKKIKEINNDIKLIFIPDAGSNQFKEHKQLKKHNIDVICLDHHEVDKESKDAIIVNNQISKEYSNKEFCGAGIVYKFLQALDDELWQTYADDYLDLLALALISDMMDIRSFETKYYINLGLENLNNGMFKEMLLKQGYTMNYEVFPKNIAFYITPLINSLIRFGDCKDKIELFESFAGINIDRTNTYKSRKKDESGNNIIVTENFYEYMTRKCINAHSKQSRTKRKYKSIIIKNINDLGINKNKIIVYNVTNILEKTMTGLVANDLAQYYNKPCLLLRKNENNNYGGSGRNIDSADFINFKQFLNNTNLFNFVEGHQNAFGVDILEKNIPELIKISNEQLKEISFCKDIDFQIPFEELTDDFIETIDEMKVLWGQNLKEPIIAIKDVYVPIQEFHLIGKNKNTISFNSEDINFIKFKANQEEYDKIIKKVTKKDMIYFDVIGTCSINHYNNQDKLQIQIIDYEIKK